VRVSAFSRPWPDMGPRRGRSFPNPLVNNGDVLKSCFPVLQMPDTRCSWPVWNAQCRGEEASGRLCSARPTMTSLGVRGARPPRAREPVPGRFTYVGLLMLSKKDLQCYFLHIAPPSNDSGVTNAICMTVSTTGANVGQPHANHGQGRQCWKNPEEAGGADAGQEAEKADSWNVPGRPSTVRPWPMRLRDGRILVLFGRRTMPIGIGGCNQLRRGKTWSTSFAFGTTGRTPTKAIRSRAS